MMQTQHATKLSELQSNILSEIPDAVIVTDAEHHVVYWNGAAERLYSMNAGQTLGRPLEACCPELWSYAGPAVMELVTGDVPEPGRWTGEIKCHNLGGQTLTVLCLASVLRARRAGPTGLLWILRDLTDRKQLEAEVRRCHELLDTVPQEASTIAEPQNLEYPRTATTRVAIASEEVVLWAEDNDDDAALLSRAWQKAQVSDRLMRLRDGTEVICYLKGDGIYSDRARFPLPSLVLLDINMPGATGLDVIHWIKAQSQFHDLPVVILTASAASHDIHEAAELGVKGYLVKPLDPMDWVLKVRTVTAQCR
jgi:PAS domain S-box-containing protein